MKKNFVIMIVVLCRICIFLNVLAADASENGYVLKDAFDGGINFTNSRYKLDCEIVSDSGNNVFKIANSGGGYNTGGEDDKTGVLSYNTNVYTSETEDIISLSFDIKLTSSTRYGQIVFSSGDERVIYTIASDKIGAGTAYRRSVPSTVPSTAYMPDTWYTLTAVINRENKEIGFFKNEEYYGSVLYTGEWGNTLSLRIDSETETVGKGNVMYIDNIEYKYGNMTFGEKIDCGLTLLCENLGQAFWGKTIDFGIEIKNNTDASKTYNVTANIINDTGEMDYTKSDIVELASGESKILEYNAELSRYAVNMLNVISADKETGEEYTLSTELVTIKKSEEQNSKIGICDHTAAFGEGYGKVDDKMQFLQNAGISEIRDMADWASWEKTAGVYEMPVHYEEVYASAKAHNMNMFLINGMNNEVVAPGERPPHSASAIESFGKYTYEMVEDTKAYASGYEVYNEWNVMDGEGSFNEDELPAEDYIPLIAEAYRQIKAANPETKVYGLSGMTWNRMDLYKSMAETMFENGVANYADGFSMHTYAHQGSPDDGVALECIEFTRGLMDKYNAADKELIISEMGWQAVKWEPETIASWLVKYSAMVHDKVDKIYWYNSQKKLNQTEAENSYGWMNEASEFGDYIAYQPLPQMRAMSNYNSYIANAEKVDEGKIGVGNAYFTQFKRSDGSDVIIAWVKDGAGKETHLVNLDTDYAIVSDIYGNETKYTTPDGKLYITLTNEPQYIVGNFDSEIESTNVSVTVINDESQVYVFGNLGLKNENLTFYVEKDNRLCYLNQIKSDSSGDYELAFPLDKEYGVYNLTIGTKYNGKTPITFSFDIEAFEIKILKGDEPVENLDDIKGAEHLTVEIKRNDKSININGSVFIAQYNQEGVLEDVKVFSNYEEAPLEIEVKSDMIERIEVLIWNMPSMQPLCETYKI